MEGETIYFVNRKSGYAAITPHQDLATSLAKKHAGLDTHLSKPMARCLMEADAAVYIDMQAVNKDFGDQIKQGRELLKQALDNAPDKSSVEQAKRYFMPLFQAASDASAVLVTADLRPDGVLAHVEMEVATDSQTNAFLKPWKKTAMADLNRLPAGHMMYTALAFTPEVMKDIGPLMYGITETEGNENKALRKALDELAEAKPRRLSRPPLSRPAASASGSTITPPRPSMPRSACFGL